MGRKANACVRDADMWMIDNRTPFAAERTWVRDQEGAEVWLVAVKGTFDIHPDGTTSVAAKQVAACLSPVFRGDPTTTSLLYDSDLNHKKLRTDVVLSGHAYAPNEEPAKYVDVRLKLGSIDKSVRVFGERIWEESALGLRMSDATPFLKMPITYERAFGGISPQKDSRDGREGEYRNPIGIGFAASADELAGKQLANVEDPKRLVVSWRDRPAPVGFGPIASHWAQRVQYGGTYDSHWERERLPLLPLDFDEQFYQCAPDDQQADGFLTGDEPVELHNATPGGLLRFRLPRVTFGFYTRFYRGGSETHRGNLHTVTIEPDYPRVIMTWHTELPCHHKVLKLLATTVIVKQRIR